MAFKLAEIVRRTKNPRRSRIVLRPIKPTSVMSGNLYRAAYAPVVSLWSEAIPRIMAEYERSLSELTTDSAADIGRELDQADQTFARIFMLIRPALNRWALQVETWHRRTWRGAVLSATGVDVDTMIGPEGARSSVATAIERNVGLVRSVSEQARTRIADSVFRGLTQRRPAREVAAEVREAVAMSRRRSMNIASHQVSQIASSLDAERRREAGISRWEWVASGKVHFRPEHQERDGVEYSDSDPPPDMPSELPNCACSSRAVLSFD